MQVKYQTFGIRGFEEKAVQADTIGGGGPVLLKRPREVKLIAGRQVGGRKQQLLLLEIQHAAEQHVQYRHYSHHNKDYFYKQPAAPQEATASEIDKVKPTRIIQFYPPIVAMLSKLSWCSGRCRSASKPLAAR